MVQTQMNTCNIIIIWNDDKQQNICGDSLCSLQPEHFRFIIPIQVLHEGVNQMLPMRYQDGLHKTIKKIGLDIYLTL